MSFDPSTGERFRIEHRMVTKDGETSTIIRKTGSVTVDHLDTSRNARRFNSMLVPGVYERLVEELHDAGFPVTPTAIVQVAEGTRVISAIRDGREHRTRPIAHDLSAEHWHNAFTILDGVAAQTTKGEFAPLPADGTAYVTGGNELKLFHDFESMDPPLGQDANEVVAGAFQLAIEHRHAELSAAHLLTAFVREHGYQLTRLGLDAERVRAAAEALFSWDTTSEPVQPEMGPTFEIVQEVARRIAAEDNSHEATLRHFARALLQAGGADVTRILQKHRLPDAMLGGRTKDRIFRDPGPAVDNHCTRCGSPTGKHRWCVRCGNSLREPDAFATGSPLDQVNARIEPYEWPERASAVHRSLCDLPDQPGTPWLSFVLEHDNQSELVGPEKLAALGLTLERAEEAAIANLARRPISWTVRWSEGTDQEVDVLYANEGVHASERILDKPFLLHAQTMLGTNALAAAVPHRGVCIVTRLEHLAVLMSLARQYHAESPDKARISPWGFILMDGVITGPISA
jgi:hypothetical protein